MEPINLPAEAIENNETCLTGSFQSRKWPQQEAHFLFIPKMNRRENTKLCDQAMHYTDLSNKWDTFVNVIGFFASSMISWLTRAACFSSIIT